MHDGIPVRRIKMYVPRRVTGASRLSADLSFLISLLRRARHPNWEPEVVITALPMLSQCIAQRFLYAGRMIPRFIIVHDFVVDAALELGILKFPLGAKALHALQNWALGSAQTLSTISPLMLEKLKGKVSLDRRLVMLPNWIHESLQREIDRQLAARPARARDVLFYSGNFGVKQGLPHFLGQFRIAAKAEPCWRLYIHGGGAEKSELEATVVDTPQVVLGDVQDEPSYVHSLLTASACLITQRPGVGANFLPSKLLPAFATGTPILAVCDRSSPLAEEILEAGCGEVVEPGNAQQLVSVLRRWKQDPKPLADMSARARQRGILYRRDIVLKAYESEIFRLTNSMEMATLPA